MTPTLGQVAYEAYWRVHITDGLWHVPPAYATLQAITRESWEAAAQAVAQKAVADTLDVQRILAGAVRRVQDTP